MTLIFGLVVLALLLWALHAFTKVKPQTAAVVLKTGGGLGAIAVAGLLGARGRLDIAIPLGLTGLGLLGWLPWSIPGLRRAHAEEQRPGVAGAFGLRGDGARSRHRRHARTHPRRAA